MKKAADIYSSDPKVIRTNSHTRTPRTRRVENTRTTPRWVVYAVLVTLTFTLCLTINFRAFSEMSREMDEHRTLSTEIENLTTKNLALQEEIHNLKSDSKLIEREAQRMGLRRPN